MFETMQESLHLFSDDSGLHNWNKLKTSDQSDKSHLIKAAIVNTRLQQTFCLIEQKHREV